MILDIIINVYNKEKSILNIYSKINEELKNVKHRFIFIDDASTDKSFEVLKSMQKKDESNIKIISFSKHYGKDVSIYAGLINSKHDLVCIYDLDLLANVSHMNKMYDFLTSHSEFDQVCMYSNYQEKKFLTKSYLNIFNKLYDLDINNNRTYYRMMRRNVIMGIKDITTSYPFTSYIFEMLGFNTYYMKFDSSNIDNTNLVKYICYSDRPLYLFKIVSYILIIITFIYFVLSVLNIIETSSFIILILLLITNIFNSYIISISKKVLTKEKTYFTIREKIGFDENVL